MGIVTQIFGNVQSQGLQTATIMIMSKLKVEETVQDHLGSNGHYQTEHSIYVYKDCGMQADGDPDADAAEAQADYEADNWRDE
jgi:hypothetical protein